MAIEVLVLKKSIKQSLPASNADMLLYPCMGNAFNSRKIIVVDTPTAGGYFHKIGGIF